MHEFVLSASRLKETHVSALDIAKRLIDYGIHPPTIYFPLVVPECLMIEPTESESLSSMDHFIAIMTQIVDEAKHQPELLKNAPHSRSVSRLDESRAVKTPILTLWDR